MADALADQPRAQIFYCHRCRLEYENVHQVDICPYCDGGFVELLEGEPTLGRGPSSDISDADMSNIDDFTDELFSRDDFGPENRVPPVLDDLAFLMSGGRLRGAGAASSGGTGPGGRRHTLMEELVWMVGGARPNTGALTAGAPFVLVGAPGDYVFGGEGLDAVVTQLLGQLERAGPPPLPRERLAELPTEPVTQEQADANIACSVCWDNFQLGENVSKLECDHVFHSSCITPWLQLHATCPICRRSLLPEQPATEDQPAEQPMDQANEAPQDLTTNQPNNQPVNPPTNQPSTQPANQPTTQPTNQPTNPLTNQPTNQSTNQPTNQPAEQTSNQPGTTPRPLQTQIRLGPRVVIRRTAAGPVTVRRFPARVHAWQPFSDAGSSSSSVSAGVWANTRSSNSSTNSSANSSGSLNSERERQYNTDLDYD